MRTVDFPANALLVPDEADAVVVGAGTAGFVAAVAAACTGAHTIATTDHKPDACADDVMACGAR